MKKFYLILCALFMSITVSATDFYLIGGFNNWTLSDPTCKFTNAGDGTYTLDYNGTLTSGFKINDGSWSNDNYNFGGTVALVIGEVYNLTASGNSANIPLNEIVINPHIVLNPTAKTLLITGQTLEASKTYGIHGTVFGTSEWQTVGMTKADNKWTLTADCVAGDFGIMECDVTTGWQTGWYSTPEHIFITEENLGQALTVQQDGGYNWSLALNGNLTFVLDLENKTLTITANGDLNIPEVGVPDDLYIVGNIGNDASTHWSTIDPILMNKTDNVFTAADIEFTAAAGDTYGYFNFITVPGSDWNLVNQADRFGAETRDVEISINSPLPIKAYAGSISAASTLSWKVAPGIYDLTVDFNSMTVTLASAAGINDIENVSTDRIIYYNLQGVEVTNPSCGLFIEVKGNLVRKVTFSK